MMTCPFCGGDMKIGRICAPSPEAVFWLPLGAKLRWNLATETTIGESGGFILGTATKAFFFAKDKLDSYYCSECRCILTFRK